MIQLAGDLAQHLLRRREIVGHTARADVVKGQCRLHLVAVPVQPLALAVVIAQKMRGIVMRSDVDYVHAPRQRALRIATRVTSTSSGCVTAYSTALATSSDSSIIEREGR